MIALAYDQLPPDQDFVVVWPAGERDFLFSCTSDGTRLRNIEPILGAPDDPRFPARSLDLAFMVWVYHHLAPAPVTLLQRLREHGPPAGPLRQMAVSAIPNERKAAATAATISS